MRDEPDQIDVFCLGEDRFDQHGLATAVRLDLGRGRTAPVASPEHMVVEKLRWYRRGGRSPTGSFVMFRAYFRSVAKTWTWTGYANGPMRWVWVTCWGKPWWVPASCSSPNTP